MKKVLFVVMVIVVVAAAGAYFFLRTGLPDYKTDITAAGLSAPVTIERNRFAVPTITAKSLSDLYFAWGYVNAQDRLFQMEFTRKIGQGRLSEFAGESQLGKDLFLRGVGFKEVAAKSVSELSEKSRLYYQRYVDGVNYYLDTKGPNIYMRLMGMKKEKWEMADALLVASMLNWSLAYNMKHEIINERIVQKLGREKAQALLSLIPPDTSTIMGDQVSGAFRDDKLAAMMRHMDWLLGSRSASNNWAIGPSKTAHGGAILCSDMQVHNSKLPNDFYLIHVKAGDFEVAGAQVAGVPFIASGYNRHCAWGLTNNGADMIDLFRESIDWQKKTCRIGGKDIPLTAKEEIFKIKGKDPVKKTIYYAGRRPVLTEVFKDLGFDVSLDWTGFDHLQTEGFFAMNAASDFDEFMEGARKIRMSPQNLVYADDKGNIAYCVIGSLPLREKGTGNFIQDGSKVERNWKGNIPDEQYPFLKNPPRGFIATANNEVMKNYPYDVNGTYAPRYRYDRIAQMLREKSDIDVAYCRSMHTDSVSVLPSKIIPLIRKYVVLDGNDAMLKKAYDAVSAWDGDNRKDSSAASIYNTFYVRFAYQTLADELGPDLAAEYIAERYVSMERFFDLIEKQSAFFDDVTTPAKESIGDIATRAFKESCALLQKHFKSDDPAKWQWGGVHKIKFDHVLGSVKMFRPLVNFGPVPFEGDGETNNRARFNEIAPPYIADLASAPRIIVRFDPAPKANMMLITGENEHFLSKHNTDMIKAFLRHEYFSDDEKAAYRMTMKPGKTVQ